MEKQILKAIEEAYRKGLRDGEGLKDVSKLLITSQIVSYEIAKLNNLLKPDVSGRSELLMDFSKFSCTEEYWEENGKIEAQEQIGAYLKYINSH